MMQLVFRRCSAIALARYSDSQTMVILNQTEASTPVSELFRGHGIINGEASMLTRLKE